MAARLHLLTEQSHLCGTDMPLWKISLANMSLVSVGLIDPLLRSLVLSIQQEIQSHRSRSFDAVWLWHMSSMALDYRCLSFLT